MRKPRNDFANSKQEVEWFDMRGDWALIESSLAAQYGIRIRQATDMRWDEFCTLINGLMPETPLGRVVSIRSEQNNDTIRKFNSDQMRIYSDWKNRQARKQLQNPEVLEKSMDALNSMLKGMFGGENE